MFPDVGNMNIYDTGLSRSGRFWKCLPGNSSTHRHPLREDGDGATRKMFRCVVKGSVSCWNLVKQQQCGHTAAEHEIMQTKENRGTTELSQQPTGKSLIKHRINAAQPLLFLLTMTLTK